MAKRFWVSWTGRNGVFELHSPWWISGYPGDGDSEDAIFCAAVVAEDEDGARQVIYDAHDRPNTSLDWRFVEERPDDWTPFNSRFRPAAWMQWPPA